MCFPLSHSLAPPRQAPDSQASPPPLPVANGAGARSARRSDSCTSGRSRVHRVVLTHFSGELDADWARAEAGAAFGGPVELAYDGAVYEVPSRGE